MFIRLETQGRNCSAYLLKSLPATETNVFQQHNYWSVLFIKTSVFPFIHTYYMGFEAYFMFSSPSLFLFLPLPSFFFFSIRGKSEYNLNPLLEVFLNISFLWTSHSSWEDATLTPKQCNKTWHFTESEVSSTEPNEHDLTMPVLVRSM